MEAKTPSEKDTRVVLITGGSTGIGEAIAALLASKGHPVYATSRRASLPTSGAEDRFPILIPMDVRDDSSIEQAVDLVMEREGWVDVLINNAGFGLAGAVEDTTVEEMRGQLETNFFGVHRVCRRVLPHMRERRRGLIINVSSLAGRIGIPFQGAYSASKFAVEGLTEALRIEVKPYGIQVVLVEPGDFSTQFTANRVRATASGELSPYSDRFETAVGAMERDEMNGPGPQRVALLVERILRRRSPRLRYTVGGVFQRIGAMLKRVLPGSWFEWMVRKSYGL